MLSRRKPHGGERPNCPNPEVYDVSDDKTHVVVSPHYRARPLDGIWATAPYLHNGSVPTLYDLLSPQDERPRSFCIGDRQFDPVKVGLANVWRCKLPLLGRETGLFRFKTWELGNSNRGHSFEAAEAPKMPRASLAANSPKTSERLWSLTSRRCEVI